MDVLLCVMRYSPNGREVKVLMCYYSPRDYVLLQIFNIYVVIVNHLANGGETNEVECTFQTSTKFNPLNSNHFSLA